MSGFFADDVVAALAAPLARKHVKQRDQGRGKVSYVEGWHVIAEANRIFGFDGWTRETIMSECCYAGEYEKAVWENGRRTDRTVSSFRCSYRARVRVTVGRLVREGTGHGHGFADNPGEAHESAEKEAETDAMKRAFMTFGNPFGLALYDKAQTEVEPAQGQRRAPPPAGERNAAPPSHAEANGRAAPATRAAPLLPHPEEPPAAAAERAQLIEGWWSRSDYGIDPETINGGLARWDYWFLAYVEAAPNLDAFLKLRADNKRHYIRWQATAAKPVVENLVKRVTAASAKLERAAA